MNDNTKTDDRPARKRYGKVKWIVGGFAVLAIAGAVGSHGGSTAKAADPAPAAASQSLGDQLRAVGGHEVAYKVTGTTLRCRPDDHHSRRRDQPAAEQRGPVQPHRADDLGPVLLHQRPEPRGQGHGHLHRRGRRPGRQHQHLLWRVRHRFVQWDGLTWAGDRIGPLPGSSAPTGRTGEPGRVRLC